MDLSQLGEPTQITLLGIIWLIIHPSIKARLSDASVTRVRRLTTIWIGVIAFIGFLAYWASSPPREWNEAAYSTQSIEDIQQLLGGKYQEANFKNGIGWVEVYFIFENQLHILPGEYFSGIGEAEIALVHIDTWIDLPVLGRIKIRSEVIYDNPALNIVGSV